MKVTHNNTHARVTEATPEEWEWIDTYLTFKRDGFRRDARTGRMAHFTEVDKLLEHKGYFPAGLARSAKVAGERAEPPVVIELTDVSEAPVAVDAHADVSWLRDYQREAFDRVIQLHRGILWMPTGAGKCLGAGTPVLLYDGRTVPVEDVRPGDVLMGPDSKPRHVFTTTQGTGPLRRIVPVKGEPWVCNDVHVLTLVHTETGRVVDVPLDVYEREWGREAKAHHALWRPFTVKAAGQLRTPEGPFRCAFDVQDAGTGRFYGFTLDGDGRFLLGDYTVTHNTECAAALMKAIPARWLFLAHRTQLAIQAGERFTLRTGEAFGVVADGRWEPARVTVATFQTLHTAMTGRSGVDARSAAAELLRSAQGIICDEVHVASAETFSTVLRQAVNAYWRVGLSGTPLQRTDQRSVLAVAAIDRPIYRVTTARLVEAGALAPPIIRMVRCLQACHKPTYQGFYGEAVVASKVRNSIIAGLAASEPGPVLVFVRQTKHGQVLRTILAKAGVDVRYVDGGAPLDRRLAAVRWLEDRTQRRVLITTTIMQEGVDIPALETVIYASGGESPIAVLQSLGRGSRTDGGRKTSFRFWDVYDEAPARSDDPQARQWGADHAKARARAYAAEWGTVYVGASAAGPFTELAVRTPRGGAL